MDDLLIQIFCDVDDFCNYYEQHTQEQLLTSNRDNNVRLNTNKCGLSLSEVMTIIIFFHLSDYRKFKNFYKKHVCKFLNSYFPNLVSYNRFVELTSYALLPMVLFLNNCCLGNATGISFIDSTPLPVCHNRRIHSNKVFKDLAQRGKTSTGWFYGFKLHLICNDCGEIVSFYISAGNIDDRDMTVIGSLTKNVFGKLFGDKGYISQRLFEELYIKGIQLITKLKSNMKNKLMIMEDKLLLRKRAIIESVNDFLKNICNIDHTRHRKPTNFLVNLTSGLCAYRYIPKKPSLNIIRS